MKTRNLRLHFYPKFPTESTDPKAIQFSVIKTGSGISDVIWSGNWTSSWTRFHARLSANSSSADVMSFWHQKAVAY